jgi:hypothetical protein
MGIFDFLKGNKKAKSEKTEKPSPEQKLFAEKAIEIVIPTFEQFGFKKHRIERKEYSSTIIYRKDKQYLEISSNTHPRDYPNYYNIVLGEGNSEDFFEYDWNSVALWRFKKEINPELKATEYEFPKDNGIEPSLKNANSELLKYGLTFLNGELELFHKVRKEQNKDREPYKIHSPDKNGNYQTSFEPKSVEQKKKYS